MYALPVLQCTEMPSMIASILATSSCRRQYLGWHCWIHVEQQKKNIMLHGKPEQNNVVRKYVCIETTPLWFGYILSTGEQNILLS